MPSARQGRDTPMVGPNKAYGCSASHLHFSSPPSASAAKLGIIATQAAKGCEARAGGLVSYAYKRGTPHALNAANT
jgi:hypothetical protein